MEKKQNFCSRQGSSKALVSEPRKSSDVFVKKSRSARQRENPNSNSKNDSQRGSKPAKVRAYMDKRPRPRGGSGSQSLNVSASSSGLVESDENFDGLSDELNSVYKQGSKKQNLNHLLNFHYSPREQDGSNSMNYFGRNGNRNYLKKHKYNKEQFLQANFQFVINSNAESSITTASSPDTLVDWSLIEQINIQATEEPQCPICLYPPIAAKLTKCGHAYCWPCILHYLALTDKTWRKCPICYDAIHLSDLKSTTIVQHASYNVGDFISLQLMQRKKGSFFIEKTGGEEHDMYIPHITATTNQKTFSKFLLANTNEILSIIERERKELISSESQDCPEFIFIQQAIDLLNERKASITQDQGALPSASVEDLQMDKISLYEIDSQICNKSNTKEEYEVYTDNLDNFEQNISVQSSCNSALAKEGRYYYFYQSVDGQNIFLHPLNVKMLQAMYGSLDRGPAVIKAKILQKEIQSMDEEHRKKFTCLGHLPLTCQFEIVEVQLDPPVVSKEVLNLFKDNLILRQKTRMRRAREEIKREREINEINERQMGKLLSSSANIDIKSAQQFPFCGSEDGSIRSSFGEASFPNDLSVSPSTMVSSPIRSPNFTSFANILSSPKKDLWPSLASNTDLSCGTSAISWVKPAASVVYSNTTTNAESLSEENATRDAAYYAKQNFGDVLAEALEQKKLTTGRSEEKAAGNSKKAKKNKKMLLFSTGMNFTGN